MGRGRGAARAVGPQRRGRRVPERCSAPPPRLARRQGRRGRHDPALRKDAVDLDLAPWQRGRYGTAVGRAVHAVLQHADLVDRRRPGHARRVQAAAEGVLGMEATIERLARSALRHARSCAPPSAHEHWRELFVATAFGEHVVEGYIDLLVRHPERGLVVVDYKTDQLAGAGDRAERLARYGRQLAAYGIALESMLGEPVDGGVLVLCRTDGSGRGGGDRRVDDAAGRAARRLSTAEPTWWRQGWTDRRRGRAGVTVGGGAEPLARRFTTVCSVTVAARSDRPVANSNCFTQHQADEHGEGDDQRPQHGHAAGRARRRAAGSGGRCRPVSPAR